MGNILGQQIGRITLDVLNLDWVILLYYPYQYNNIVLSYCYLSRFDVFPYYYHDGVLICTSF